MKIAAKEAFENNMHHLDIMKTIAKVYLSNRECSVYEAVYHILSEWKLGRSFPAVYFVNTNLPDKRVHVLLSEKELSKLPGDSPHIVKRSYIDLYMERPSASFCNRKYSVLNDFCYAEFLVYFTRENKSNKTCQYQSDELDDNMIETNHEECSYLKRIKLIINKLIISQSKTNPSISFAK